jgi:hypothetical protein
MMNFQYCKDRLLAAGVSFDPGLSASEISVIERAHSFSFPPDLKDFLMYALPVSKGWVDWRRASTTEIRDRLNWPIEGMCFDIEHNVFWLDAWGPRPADNQSAFELARKAVAIAPRLIPVCGHRYLPDRPSEQGNPVFSVYQTDLIYYGANLFDFLCNEFSYHFGRPEYAVTGEIRRIEFWSDLVDR